MKPLLIVLVLCLTACGCPIVDSPDVRDEFTAERDAACKAVDGCYLYFLSHIPVHKVPSIHASGVCDSVDAVACYCTGVGCSIIFVDPQPVLVPGSDLCPADPEWGGRCLYTPEMMMTHEYTHAAFDSIGVSTHDHPPFFWAALKVALGR